MPKGIYSRKASSQPVVYVAKESFTTLYEGNQISVLKGVTVQEGHPLLSGLEHLFAPQKIDYPVADEPDPEPEPAAKPEASKKPKPMPVSDEPLSSVAPASAFSTIRSK